ncbi:hypothetical protein [Streptomyces osmaniensis]|uniref:Uncharacterized protein n=1 Tax=Streptomyces osmaniensis TaxID=593134 RepID=A0ABP6V781_9ACTN|nr:hypothetical protein KJK32_16985 [Streptomyces sp. JCM17656]
MHSVAAESPTIEASKLLAAIPFIIGTAVQLFSALLSKAINKKVDPAGGNTATAVNWATDVSQAIGAISTPVFGAMAFILSDDPATIDGWVYFTYAFALIASSLMCVWVFSRDVISYGKGSHGGAIVTKIRLNLSPVTFWSIILNVVALLVLLLA